MEMSSNNTIFHIVFITDENYVMPTVVAISSIYQNKKVDTQYCIHVICCDTSEKSQSIFGELKKDKFDIQIINVTQDDNLKNYQIKNLHVSTAALYKFNLGNLFPDVDTLLYLDGDILVQQNLESIFEVDISNVYAAVVKDYKPMTYDPPQVTKLGIEHSAYFNSGVMLLNLKKFRDDDLFHQLLDYRLHGINYFMDQDALNVVFAEKVIYLSLYYNVMSSVMGFFTLDDLISYYELDNVRSKNDIYQRAIIVHLCTKYKPWNYSNVPFADEWYRFYQLSPIDDPLCRDILERTDFQTFKEFGLGDDDIGIQYLKQNVNVIVSLTSFPDRINTIHLTIQSLIQQSYSPNKIILWLAKEQFPNGDDDLPPQLQILKSNSLFTIKWCDDLRPHKKYFYAMQEYPDSIIITVDDDVIYSRDIVHLLLESYQKFPYAISALRVHLIRLTEDKKIAPYKFWKREIRDVGIPSLALCATGVGGVLYPPHILPKETFNKKNIQELCLNADDLWLKTMELVNCIPVVLAAYPAKIEYIPESQENALWKKNDINGGNDAQFKALIDIYDSWYGDEDTLMRRLEISVNAFHRLVSSYNKRNIKKIEQQKRFYQNELREVHASWSYRIGRFITFLPRKIRGGLRCYHENGMSYTLYRVKEKFLALIRR